jgi:hypothetical protein
LDTVVFLEHTKMQRKGKSLRHKEIEP